jgi:hypothetical protein
MNGIVWLASHQKWPFFKSWQRLGSFLLSSSSRLLQVPPEGPRNPAGVRRSLMPRCMSFIGDFSRRVMTMIVSIVYIGIFALSALIPYLFYWLHKRSAHPLDMEERSLLSSNLGFFNGLYAFFLGFAIVTLWTSYNTVQDSVGKEAQAINNLYRLALAIPGSEALRENILRYNSSIINDEWKDMDRPGKMNEKTQELYHELWYRVHALEPKSEKDKIFYDKLVDKLQGTSDLRVQRFVSLQGHLYPLLWVIIIVGAIFAIIEFYYLSTGKHGTQLIFDSIMIAMLLLNIWLISELNTPFSGYVKVSPLPFEIVQSRMTIMTDTVEHFKKIDSKKVERREMPGNGEAKE